MKCMSPLENKRPQMTFSSICFEFKKPDKILAILEPQ